MLHRSLLGQQLPFAKAVQSSLHRQTCHIRFVSLKCDDAGTYLALSVTVDLYRCQHAHHLCCTGLSLGEYCALVFAGVLSFEDGLKVVKARAEGMAAAAILGENTSHAHTLPVPARLPCTF